MENINFDIACEVKQCKFNHSGNNCTLNKIKVGNTYDDKHCTCCKSYEE